MIPRGRGLLPAMRRQALPPPPSSARLLRPTLPSRCVHPTSFATGTRYCSPLRPQVRVYSNDATPPPPDEAEPPASDPEDLEAAREHGSFYISNVFPIKLSSIDLRPNLAALREQTLMDQLCEIVEALRGRHAFRLESWEIARKDGGVFCHFTYQRPKLSELPRKHHAWATAAGHAPEDEAPDPTGPAALFLPPLLESAHKHGGWPSWLGRWWSNWTDKRGAQGSAANAGHEYYAPGGVPVREPEVRGWQRSAGAGRAWIVKGRQWTEDLSRYPSSQLKVEFAGPDVGQEVLYSLFRPYGRILQIVPPTPVPAGALRYALLKFSRISPAVAASNCLHSYAAPVTQAEYDLCKTVPDAKDVQRATLKIAYERPLKGHYFRDWVRDHPKIAIPVLAFLLGGLSYSFFDPIRSFFVKNDIEGTWDLEKYQAIKYVKDNVWAPFYNTVTGGRRGGARKRSTDDLGRASWQDRMEAEANIDKWIREFPSTFIVVTGPQGSGKHELVQRMIESAGRPALEIDCANVARQKTDGDLVAALADETGYWPVFSFLQSMNGLIDLASQGLIGQKAGFATPIDEQLRAMLDVVTRALKDVTADEHSERADAARHRERERRMASARELEREAVRSGVWHDGRLDCVAGNGPISELGMGFEPTGAGDASTKSKKSTGATLPAKPASLDTDGVVAEAEAALADEDQAAAAPSPASPAEDDAPEGPDTNAEAISTLPIVVLRNFSAKPARGDLWRVLAEWGAGLLDNQVAHVVVVGEGSLTTKALTHALPSKPLNHVTLSDADDYNSLEFVREKLSRDPGVNGGNASASASSASGGDDNGNGNGNGGAFVLSERDKKAVSRLGGRMVDLELLVYKVRGGQSITQAVADIVLRNEVELRKAAFGDDSEDAAALPWSRAQAWSIVTQLASKPELSYEKLLQYWPFKGGDMALKAMEERDIVTIAYRDGRPYVVRPGKPVFREAFRQLERDDTFRAAAQIAYNNAVIAAAEAAVKAAEDELATLKGLIGDGDGLRLGNASKRWFDFWGKSSPVNERARYLLDQMEAALKKIDGANADNARQLDVFNAAAPKDQLHQIQTSIC